MTDKEKKDTKSRILREAAGLFSQHGFSGTSVRMIAEKSEVNLAAINYHFGNKENLYWDVINEAYDWIESGVEKVTADSKDFEDLSIRLFRFFMKGSHYIRTTMKTFLSGNIPRPAPDHPYNDKIKSKNLGPPGSPFVIRFIQSQYKDISTKDCEWVVMGMFSSVFHFATMCSTAHFEVLEKAITDKDIEKVLKNMSRSMIFYVTNKEK